MLVNLAKVKIQDQRAAMGLNRPEQSFVRISSSDAGERCAALCSINSAELCPLMIRPARTSAMMCRSATINLEFERSTQKSRHFGNSSHVPCIEVGLGSRGQGTPTGKAETILQLSHFSWPSSLSIFCAPGSPSFVCRRR